MDDFQRALHDMKDNYLLSGREETLTLELTVDTEGKNYLNGIELITELGRTGTNRSFQIVRDEILSKLGEFIGIRFSSKTDKVCEAIKPFFEFKFSQQNVRVVHEIIAPEFDATELYLQFRDVCNNPTLKTLSLDNLMQYLVENDEANNLSIIKVVLARLLAATPHSADVKRSISANIGEQFVENSTSVKYEIGN